MTALSADARRTSKGASDEFGFLADGTLYKGALAMINTSGYLVPGADTANFLFAGIVVENFDNADGSAGDADADGRTHALVYRKGKFKFAKSGTIVQGDVGKKAYAVDDNTVALAATTTNDIFVGIIVAIDGSDVWIDIEPAIANA